MHDDICYETDGWGEKIVAHFQDSNTGALGIAGTPYYPFMPASWWGSGIFYEHLLQSSLRDTTPVLKSNMKLCDKKQVTVFDGVWFCIRRAAFKKVKFDELTFNGFHGYDLDICMQLNKLGVKMYCIGNIVIHHTSIGKLTESWIQSILLFQKKWKRDLPSTCIARNSNELFRAEYRSMNEFLSICEDNGWTSKARYSVALSQVFMFKPGYGYYKTPGYLLKFLVRYFQ